MRGTHIFGAVLTQMAEVVSMRSRGQNTFPLFMDGQLLIWHIQQLLHRTGAHILSSNALYYLAHYIKTMFLRYLMCNPSYKRLFIFRITVLKM